MIKCTIVNTETGEIISENYKLHELKDKVKAVKFAEKKEIDEQFKNMQHEYLGYFVFFIFENMEYLKTILSDNDLVKFIMLGTYTKSDGILKLDNNSTSINKKTLLKMLNVARSNFYAFYNKILENGLIKEDENEIFINMDYFYRGSEKNYNSLTGKKLQNYTRLYIDTTRELYNQFPVKMHKRLAIVYKLLPFISWKYNIICKNPNETEKEKVIPLTVLDVLEIIGYDKSHLTKFKKDFYGMKYNNYDIFMTIQNTYKYTESLILVNPLLLYRGNDLKEFEWLLNVFKICNNNTDSH